MFIDKEKNLLVIEKEKDPVKLNKKISGHAFVDILGLNPFKLSGDALLVLHGLVTEKVDEKWLRRGDLAEKIVKTVYERNGHNCTIYDEEYKKANYYTCFPKLRSWGGLIDIELLDEKTLIEVKSKSLDKFDYIVKEPPMDEVYQGLYYGFLRKYDEIIMEWIFFDPKTEEEVFAGKTPTTLKNLKRHTQRFEIEREEMETLMNKVANIVQSFRESLVIPLDTISPKYMKMLVEQGLLPEEKENNKIEMPF